MKGLYKTVEEFTIAMEVWRQMLRLRENVSLLRKETTALMLQKTDVQKAVNEIENLAKYELTRARQAGEKAYNQMVVMLNAQLPEDVVSPKNNGTDGEQTNGNWIDLATDKMSAENIIETAKEEKA
jgi:hypothetical protein